MRIILFLTFSTLLASCSGKKEQLDAVKEKKISSRIYGGQRVVENKWKSVVSISKLNFKGEIGNSFCTGTLIDEKTVLSAAHCFSRVKEYYMRSAAITREDIDSKKRTYTKIKNIRLHPNYTGKDSAFDFALIDLENSAGVEPADITALSSTKDILEGEEVELVGFGKIEDGSNGIKFEVRTKVREDLDIEFTAGGNGKDTCSGDSGGPVFTKNKRGEYEFFGVTSRTPDDANTFCGDKTIYGKVSVAMNWVKAERLIDLALEENSLESIALLKKAKIVFPKYFKLYTLLGEFYLKFEMFDKAIANLSVANNFKIDDFKTIDLLRETYARMGNVDAEVLTLKRLLTLDPNNEKYFERLDFFGETDLAEIYRGIGRFKKGDIELAKLDLELHMGDPMAAFIMAFSELKMSNFEESKKILSDLSDEDIIAINFRDKRGDTFLLAAVYEGREELVSELLRFKPDLSVRDVYGNNLAEVAWWAKNFHMIKLLRGLGVEWNPNDYFLQFTYFIKGEKLDDVRFMLEMGIDLSLVGPKGETAINLARETKNQELIELVESYGKEEKSH